MKQVKRFKRGDSVIKLPLEERTAALVIKVKKADKIHAYCNDGGKYHQKNGRSVGKVVLGKKDTILLPPFGFTAEEEAERIRNIAIRNRELAIEEAAYQDELNKQERKEHTKKMVAFFELHKQAWKKAYKIKTVLGTVKCMSITASGHFCGETIANVITVLLKKKKDVATGQVLYVARASVISGIESELHEEPLIRLFSLEAKCQSTAETIGTLLYLSLKKDIA